MSTRSWLPLVAAAWLAGLLWRAGTPEGTVGAWPALLALVTGAALSALATLTSDSIEARWPRLILCACAAAAGGATPSTEPTSTLPAAGLARIEADVVASSARGRQGGRAVVRVVRGERIEDRAVIPAGALLRVTPVLLPEGARVRVVAQLSAYAPFRNPSPHPRPPDRFALVGRARVASDAAVTVLAHPWPSRWLARARERVREALCSTLDPRSAALARALVLGDDGVLDDETIARVRDSGLLHVLAVSGLHVAIVAGLLVRGMAWMLLWTPIARRCEAHRVACALGAPLALAYAAFAGGAPSAWRAAVTAACAWSLTASGRRPETLQTTCAAALLLGGAVPSEAVRPAFLLSVAATVAIVSTDDRELPAPLTFARWIASAFRVSWRATLATAPIVLTCFGALPVVGVLANVVLLPFGSLLLVQLSALHAAMAVLSTPLGELTGAVFTTTSRAFLLAADLLGSALPSLRVPPLDRAQVLALAGACTAALVIRRLHVRLAVCGLLLACLAPLELRLRRVEAPRGTLRVSFLDVGQGDATLIDLPDGRLMLIDAGGAPGGGPDPGRAVLAPLLAARRRDRIDIMAITHPHPDHYGGVEALLQAVVIGEIWDNGQADAEADLDPTLSPASALLRKARERNIPIRTPKDLCDRPLAAGPARVRVLWPCPHHESGYDPNDNSLVIHLHYGRHRFLFTGDAESLAEGRLLRLGEALRANVLKVGHHGSRTSTTPAFLAAVRPQLGVLSAGAGNRYGHPHEEVVRRLVASGVVPIELAAHGGTLATSDGRKLRVRSWSGWNRDLP